MSPAESSHAIRLAGPWQRETIDRHGQKSEPSRIKLPDATQPSPDDSRAEAIYTRAFHRPTGLQSSDRVFVEVASTDRSDLPRDLTVWLNEDLIAPSEVASERTWIGLLPPLPPNASRLVLRTRQGPLRATVRLLIDANG